VIPVERALLPEVNITGQQNYNVEQHLDKTEETQLTVHEGPRVKKYSLDVEQNEHQGDEVKLNGERFARVARRTNTALVRLILGARPLVPADEDGKRQNRPRNAHCCDEHQQQRAVRVEEIAVHVSRAVIIRVRAHSGQMAI
jgi:hypothetical protein